MWWSAVGVFSTRDSQSDLICLVDVVLSSSRNPFENDRWIERMTACV